MQGVHHSACIPLAFARWGGRCAVKSDNGSSTNVEGLTESEGSMEEVDVARDPNRNG
jgi:hypothetical protein